MLSLWSKKAAKGQLTEGEMWAEFAQLSFPPHATLVTLSLGLWPQQTYDL
jgi:hypothetical protein